jgi:hypothetical protein
LVEETAALNVSTERLKTIELWQPVPVRYRTRGKNDSCLCWVLQGVIMKDEKCMFRDCLKGGSSLSFYSNRYIYSFSIWYIMTSRAYIRLSLANVSSSVVACHQHLYVCLEDCVSSSVVTCHQRYMCFAVCWWRTCQPCDEPVRVDRFHLYYEGPRQDKHTESSKKPENLITVLFVISSLDFIRLFIYSLFM